MSGTLALALSAKIQIPFWPVPLTMQTLVVLLIGMAYGWRLGGATLLLYLAEGAVGLPVFAGTPEKGIGLAYMLGTTGGYLLGFALAAAACGALAERGWDRSFARVVAAMLIGNAIIYSTGVLWLGLGGRVGQAGAGMGCGPVPPGRPRQGRARGCDPARGMAHARSRAIGAGPASDWNMRAEQYATGGQP